MAFNWIVSLSDGQRISYNNLVAEDNKNPWDKITAYLKENNIGKEEKKYITHVELIVNGVRYQSPSLSRNAVFKTSEEIKGFWVFYKSVMNLSGSQEDYVSVSYRLGDYRYFLWVNQQNNVTYTQILNMVNPTLQEEKDFVDIDKFVLSMYI
jgi:hypothetical protein